MDAVLRRRAVPLVALAALAAGLLGACRSSERGASVEAPAPQRSVAAFHGTALSPARPKPDFTLVDTAGRPFNLRRDTEGAVTLLFFGYTSCPDICPTHMAQIGLVMKELSPATSSRIKVVFVTVDPERDTPERLKRWLAHFSPDFIGLTGSQEAIDAAQVAAGVPVAYQQPYAGGEYTVAHSATVLAYTADNLAHLGYPLGTSVAGWTHDLPRLVENGWSNP